MSMDRKLRRTLNELRGGYRGRAIDKMQEEAIFASSENAALRRERDDMLDRCRQLMAKQAQGFEQKVKAHIEMEVMSTSAKLQKERLRALERRISQQTDNTELVRQECHELDLSLAELSKTFNQKQQLSDKLDEVARRLRVTTKKRDSTKKAVIECVQSMVSDAILLTEKQRQSESDKLVKTVLGRSYAVDTAATTVRAEVDDGDEVGMLPHSISHASDERDLNDITDLVSALSRSIADEGEADLGMDDSLAFEFGRLGAGGRSGTGFGSRTASPFKPPEDPERMWKSTKANCALFSGPLRELLKQQKKKNGGATMFANGNARFQSSSGMMNLGNTVG